MRELKYIRTVYDDFLLFPVWLEHSAVAESIKVKNPGITIESAGFVKFFGVEEVLGDDMSGIKQLEKIIEELKENQLKMDARLRELEANSSGRTDEGIMTPEDLRYILRTQGQEAYDAARKGRNRQMRERMRGVA